MSKLSKYLLLLLFVATVFSCRNQNRMFQTDKSIVVDSIQRELVKAEENYIIRKNDYISVSVYTNGGEKLIDPNAELTKQKNAAVGVKDQPEKYLIRDNGYVKLPMIGDIKLDGYTVVKADSVLAVAYTKFYESPFVVTCLLNKRVIVLGPTPVPGKVIPLENENMNVIEIIALYGGIPDNGKAHNIRLIRGSLKNPNVEIIDLSTIEGMRRASLDVQPNDIIYIEPVRKLFFESLREIQPITSLILSLASLSLTFILYTRLYGK